MECGELRVGATHTGRILGYCPACALYHTSETARESCARLANAVNPSEQMISWYALKAAVVLEAATSTAGI
jgi:hypothetical protein